MPVARVRGKCIIAHIGQGRKLLTSFPIYDAFVAIEAISSRAIVADAAEIRNCANTRRQRDLKQSNR